MGEDDRTIEQKGLDHKSIIILGYMRIFVPETYGSIFLTIPLMTQCHLRFDEENVRLMGS